MKIHLLPDAGMDAGRVERIKELLEETHGAIRFRLHAPVPVKTLREEAGFDELFAVVSAARASLGLPSNEYLILLTDRPNRNNYFAKVDPKEPHNAFVHAGDWKLYIQCEDAVPVAFTVLNIVLLHKMEPDPRKMDTSAHKDHIGCVNDFCDDKRHVIFKLRTGDICIDCISRMRTWGLSDLYLDHAIRILGHLSGMMKHHFAFKRNLPLSRMVIDLKAGTLMLPDLDGAMVAMDPIDLTYYVLLLFFQDGILNDAWTQDEWVGKIWLASYGVVRPLLSARELAATIRTQCVSERERNIRTRKVKKAFQDRLGPNIAKDYILYIMNGIGRKVTLPRDLVTIRNFNSLTNLIEGNEALQEVWRTMQDAH